MDTEVLDDSAEASASGVAHKYSKRKLLKPHPRPTAAESHVHEVADVEGSQLSKLAALRVVYGPRLPT